MGLKVKTRQEKIRRRGNRLIVSVDGEVLVHLGHKGRWYIVEARRPAEHYNVTYSPCRNWALLKGEYQDAPVQIVGEGDFYGKRIAYRTSDDEGWVFFGPDENTFHIPITHTGLRNVALAMSAVVARIPDDLARFLGCEPLLCNHGDIEKIHADPRYRRLRDFKFNFRTPDAPLGSGRKAASVARHQFSNYDEMLREGARDTGGLLYPEQYEQLRKGVDLIVKASLGGAA